MEDTDLRTKAEKEGTRCRRVEDRIPLRGGTDTSADRGELRMPGCLPGTGYGDEKEVSMESVYSQP